MNQERAVILLTILGIISGSSEGLWSIPDSNKYAISWLDIMYSDFKTEVHYRIEQKGEFYYSNKQEIDPELIQQLSESFTDFYENIDYEGSSIVPDYYEHLLYVEVYLINGKEMILGSDSDRYCYIPWNIIYEGKYYLQYNGKIPSALFRILKELGDESWSYWYGKEARWGCPYSISK